MTIAIHKLAEDLLRSGRTDRVSVCLYCPAAGLVSPVSGIRGFVQLDGIEVGMT